MIHLIIGENTLVRQEAVAKLTRGFKSAVERIDGGEITLNQLADLVRGGTLFAPERIVVIRELSANKPVWEKLADWSEQESFAGDIILVEPRPDKRLKPYKTLVKHAQVTPADYWSDRDLRKAEEWTDDMAKRLNMKLSLPQVREIVQRALQPGDRPGSLVIDQFMIVTALRSLSVLEEVTDEAIETVLPAPPSETVFRLVELACRGEAARAMELAAELRATEDAYAVFAALAGQWTQLVGLTFAEGSDLGVHPYAAGKLRQLGKGFTNKQLRSGTLLAADLDGRLKRSEIAPWDAVDRMVLMMARVEARE